MTERMSAAEFLAGQAETKGTKRVAGSEPVIVHGIRFASKKEARRYDELLLLKKAGKISELRLQVPIDLIGQNGPILTDSGSRPRRYIADFRYFDNDLKCWVIEDAKGHPTEIYMLKRAILAAQGIKIREV
jgi:hypothetical protein